MLHKIHLIVSINWTIKVLNKRHYAYQISGLNQLEAQAKAKAPTTYWLHNNLMEVVSFRDLLCSTNKRLDREWIRVKKSQAQLP